MAVVATFDNTKKSGVSGIPIQGSTGSLQGSAPKIQGSAPKLQGSSPALQSTANPMNYLNVAPAAGAGGGVGGAVYDPVAAAAAAARNKLNSLRGGVQGKRGAVQAAYDALFGDLDILSRDRAAEIERKTGENINKLTEGYTSSIPQIQSSYAALGADNSTDTRDAKIKAKSGYDDSIKQVGEQKESDLAKVGQYGRENKAKFGADRDSIFRLIDQAAQSEDEGDIRNASNEIDNRLGQATATRATLGTDAGARGQLSAITADAGRFDSIKASLDNIMSSSLAGGVKAAAVEAATTAAGISDEDKQKIKLQYGNIYDAPTV